MFKLTKNRLVKAWPATVSLATDNGEIQTHEITLDLVLLDTGEFNDLSRQGDPAFFKKVIKGWDGIGDENGDPLPFNTKTLKAAVQNPAFTAAALSAYMDAAQGRAATKNLPRQ
ncbi:hypothetical protein [Thaumasiovibrio subtropicus]|uniref:hypothetical protein n=1 Tax=Thaumasiovibrio subtropicus TaxID=1891207 RepID=UPI000B3616AD|nr:hypothetical protein [Thaumasiovibrio subtropicus]